MSVRTVFLSVGFSIVLCLFLLLTVTAKSEELVADWFRSGSITVVQEHCFPDNTFETFDNLDCDYIQESTGSCILNSSIGQVNKSGNLVINDVDYPLRGYSRVGTVMPLPASEGFYSMQPGAPVGLYMAFHYSLQRMHLDKQTIFGLPPRTEYSVAKPYDYWLTDAAGTKLPVNPFAMAFSKNGQWMAFDVPKVGMFRANLASMTLTPFAPSVTATFAASTMPAQLAISNDGTTVAVAASDELRLYGLAACQKQGYIRGEILKFTGCTSRDVWNDSQSGPGVRNQIPGNAIVRGNLRFIDNYNLRMIVRYEYVSNQSFKAGEYIVSAVGAGQHKLGLLALGDSYISGEGAHGYRPGTDTDDNKCHLSEWSHPYLLGHMYFDSYGSVACAGAVINDIINASPRYAGQAFPKLDEGSRTNKHSIKVNFSPGYLNQNEFVTDNNPKAVLLSIGGNNIHFADIVKSCVDPTNAKSQHTCMATYEERIELAENIRSIFGQLVETYTKVQKEMNGGTLYVTGYPSVVKTGGNCGNNVLLNAEEAKLANDIVTYLNLTIQRAAQKSGAVYVDIQDALVGGRLCENDALYMNGATAGNDKALLQNKQWFRWIGNESYHPTKAGYAEIAEAIKQKTNGFTLRSSGIQSNLTLKPTLNDAGELITDTVTRKTNNPVRTLRWDGAMSNDLVLRGQTVRIQANGVDNNTLPGSSYSMVLHSEPVQLGTAVANANGDITSTAMIPADIPAGYHTLHLYGKGFDGLNIDIRKVVYVAASETDFDGDGVPNVQSDCMIYPDSGVDYDKDGIDDACDGAITQPPVTPNENTVVAPQNPGVDADLSVHPTDPIETFNPQATVMTTDIINGVGSVTMHVFGRVARINTGGNLWAGSLSPVSLSGEVLSDKVSDQNTPESNTKTRDYDYPQDEQYKRSVATRPSLFLATVLLVSFSVLGVLLLNRINRK